MNKLHCIVLTLVLTCFGVLSAQNTKEKMIQEIDANASSYWNVAKDIWTFAELGYQEERSSALLQKTLKDAGFDLKVGVADIPTAFIAEYGSGEPVIALLAEFDALPGLSQDSIPVRAKIMGKASGHACGHHLFGTASVAAAITLKNWMASSQSQGTLRLYGTPAEEGGAGKVYMVRDGLFDDVDAVLHWHPGDRNSASPSNSLANKSGKFRFYGKSAHAAAAPHRGRSALDGVEAMNYMVNLMREHVPQETRMHYVITKGGDAPNIVPEFAEVYYYIRHPQAAQSGAIFDRVVEAAKGAAMGTGTRMEFEVIHGLYNLLPNKTLAKVVYENLNLVGGYTFSAEEEAFAHKIRESLGDNLPDLTFTNEVQPFVERPAGGSTDVGDVSWVVPTAGMSSATWVPGTPAHSWQAVASGGMSIGMKGMLVAAKTLAASGLDLFQNPQVIKTAEKERREKAGDDFIYKALLGDRKPPLDYRN
ncbi:MAG: amidohydrolase [Bacteroidota bacterium]